MPWAKIVNAVLFSPEEVKTNDVTGRVLGARGVDGAHRRALDHEHVAHARIRSAASRTASRIFS